MKLKKIKTTFYVTTLLLAVIGGNTVYTATKGAYATYKRGEQQQATNHPVPLPNFMIESPKREEYALFWGKLDKEIDRQEENRRVK